MMGGMPDLIYDSMRTNTRPRWIHNYVIDSIRPATIRYGLDAAHIGAERDVRDWSGPFYNCHQRDPK
jgi:hypothetical protein